MSMLNQTCWSKSFFVLLLFFLLLKTATATTVEKMPAQAWLKKIQLAARKLNYSGTFIYQQGNQSVLSRIVHVLQGKRELEKLEVLDDKPREYIRNNEEITCYIPGTKVLFIEKRVTPDTFPAILAVNPVELSQHYYLGKGEKAVRIANFDSQEIILEPKDKLRYGYKLWAEKSTGLLLRAQTLNEKKEVIEQIAFNHIEIRNIDPKLTEPSFKDTSGWHIENAIMSQINSSDWSVKKVPAGFKKIRQMKRLILHTPTVALSHQLTFKEAFESEKREMRQIVFSDGLAAISVFIEPFADNQIAGSMQQGAINILRQRYQDSMVTVVGEVPAEAVRLVANSIHFNGK